MHARTAPHLLDILTAPARRLKAAIAARIERLNTRIDAADMPRRHRMGTWEASASLRAREARDAMERNAGK